MLKHWNTVYMFKLVTDFAPTGDQPAAIEQLVTNIEQGVESQILLGVTGSGKMSYGCQYHCPAKPPRPYFGPK